MAVLYRVRSRNERLRVSLFVFCLGVLTASCEPPPDPETLPDEVLQVELGLTERDRVHRVTVTGGEEERGEPVLIAVEPGSYVEFVTTDWLIHEVIFEADSLLETQWSFLERTDQTESPPLIELDSRYVLSFEGAPEGRYPYRIEGNGAPGRGVIVVTDPERR